MELHITNAGQKLLYKAQGGKILKFTRFGLGDGELSEQSVETLTSLINEKMVSTLTKLDVRSSKVILGMSFNNSELLEGFYFRELGLFAEDPETKEEVLYLYGNSGETSDYIDDKNGRVIEERLDVEIYVSNVENITATIDNSLIFATQQELNDLKNQVDGIVVPTKTSELEKDDVYTKQEVDNKINEIDIPTKTSELEKDDVYTKKEVDTAIDNHTPDLSAYTKTENLADVALTGKYDDLKNKPSIPSATSELNNDSNFRSITYGTTALEAGVSALTTGSVYLEYE